MRELIRDLYYRLASGRVVELEKPALLAGKKWKIDMLAGRSYWNGYYEPPITHLLISKLRSDSVFFDIGSNVGYFGLLAATIAPDGFVHSFEPDKPTFDYSESIRQLNAIPNWTINQQGVGSQTETLFYQPGPTSTTGSISGTTGDPVQIVALDDYVRQHNITRIDLMKIDVEGFGGNVLRGASYVLRQLKPALIMELHAGTEEYAAFDELITPYYQLSTVEGAPVKNVTTEGVHQVLAIPK